MTGCSVPANLLDNVDDMVAWQGREVRGRRLWEKERRDTRERGKSEWAGKWERERGSGR